MLIVVFDIPVKIGKTGLGMIGPDGKTKWDQPWRVMAESTEEAWRAQYLEMTGKPFGKLDPGFKYFYEVQTD